MPAFKTLETTTLVRPVGVVADAAVATRVEGAFVDVFFAATACRRDDSLYSELQYILS